jgi:two-component system chemotaxis response regulator CheV
MGNAEAKVMTEEKDMTQLQLEIGGSFFELIEFSLTRKVNAKIIKGIYGVNVAKVREVVRMPKINSLASRVKGVAGVFELRGIPIPAVSLNVALGDDESEIEPSQQIIVTEFSQKRAGFIVDSTHRIRRVAWDKVLPPSADAGSCINGMTLIEDNEFLFILDLEKILMNLEFGEEFTARQSSPIAAADAWTHAGQPQPGMAPKAQTPQPAPTGPVILLVDDSQFIRNGVKQAMLRAGYRVVEAGDGQEALSVLERGLAGQGPQVSLVVTDVEMPRMDGLSFTKRVREHGALAETPILLHTSLSGKANQAAGIQVGANGYVIKNDFRSLFELMKEILGSAPDALSA